MKRSMMSIFAKNSELSLCGFAKYMCSDKKSTWSKVCSITSYSQAPKVGIARCDDPQAANWIDESTHFMTLAASVAARPYSVAVFWQICQGPSISFPRHQNLTPCGQSYP